MEDVELLITDLDGTLLGHDASLAEFAEWYRPRRDRLRLVYNSGRLVSSVLELIAATRLPQPDAIIGGVGTQIQCVSASTAVSGWLADCDGWCPRRVRSVLAEFDELVLQPAEFLSDHKISYHVHNAPAELLAEIRRRLAAAGCRFELVYSSNRDLDVLPAGVNKGSASRFLAEQWSLDTRHMLVSGDTANDLALFEIGCRGIVVGNAHQELRSLDSRLVFQATRPYAAGVLQGLSHWLERPEQGLSDTSRQPVSAC